MKLTLVGLLLLAGLVASFPAGYDEPKPVEPKPYEPPPPPPPVKTYEPPPPIVEKPYVPPPPPPPPDKPYVPPKPQVQPPRYRRESPPAPPTPAPPPGAESDQSAVKVETLAITDKSGPVTDQVTTQAATIVGDKVQRERRQTKEEEKDGKKPPQVAVILPAEITIRPNLGSQGEHTEKTVELTTAGKVRDARNVDEATTQKDLGTDKTTEGSEGSKHETGTSTPFVDKVRRERRQTKEEEKDGKKPPVVLPAEITIRPQLGSHGDKTEKTDITVELTTEGKVRGARNAEEATTQKDLGTDKTTEGSEGTKQETGTSTPFVDKVRRERRQTKEEEKDDKKPPVVLPAEITIRPQLGSHDDKTEKTDITVELTTEGKVRGARNVEEATTQKAFGTDKTTEGSDETKHHHHDGHDHKHEEVTTTKITILNRNRRQAPPAPPAVDPVEPAVDPAVDPAEPADGQGENGEPQEGEETGTLQPFDPNADNPPTDEEKPAGFDQNPETAPKDETGEAEENGRHARQAPETKPAEDATTEKTLLPADCIKESGTCIVFGEARFRCCVAKFQNCCTRPALVDQKPTQ